MAASAVIVPLAVAATGMLLTLRTREAREDPVR
jgi:hypothetical protein